jgi:2,4-dienoyl-CoA reductase-like NADH-dependent reductase (Old Yellow Enzyme family)/thioredoxin reductase
MKLFEPIQVGSLELKNRIVMPPMVTNFASETGAVTERLVRYHVERATGGVGLIIVEATCVEGLLGRLVPNQLRVDGDKYIPGLANLVDSVHRHGTKLALQIHHAGRQTTLESTDGRTPVSSSNVPFIDMYTTPGSVIAQPRPLKIEEVAELVEKFGEGARRAKTAGFDAVEIHGAHGYLIEQFLSPYTNKRNDSYGGSFDGRMRFALDIIERIRKKTGSDFPLSFRISADEFIEGGITLELAERIVVRLEEAGINIIHVSASLGESNHMCEAPMAIKRGFLVHLAEGVKNVVNIPVIAVGRINDPELAEDILQKKKADLIAMGRALIADPQLPLKAMQGRFEEVRKCIACDYGCSSRLYLGLPITCNINADVGKEEEYRITKAEKVKRVLIIGGGLAGMEAARVAALRGHQVKICEKSNQLGGQFILATKPPHKEELQNLLDYLRFQMGRLNVEVELRKEATPELIDEEEADAVVVATGAVPYIPQIPGIESERVSTAWDVLAGKVDPKGEIVVIGGGEVGCETTEYLAELDRCVTLVEAVEDLALDMEPLNRYLLLQRLKMKKIRALTGTVLREITDEGVVISSSTGERKLEAGGVVLALGAVPDNKLTGALKRRVDQLFVVGDCVKPRRSLEAVHEGSWAARQI